MNTICFVVFGIFLLSYSSCASQIVTEVELRKQDGILFNQSGEVTFLKHGWMEQKDFDISLETGNCPTYCGVHCPMDILSESRIYIYKSNPSTFPFFGKNIDLLNGDFDTSAQYYNNDTIQFCTIPLQDYLKYYIFKASSGAYFLLIIDSLKISGECPPEDPLCCTAHGIDVIYGKIIIQTNGSPYFDEPVPIFKRDNFSYHYKSIPETIRIIDIQGRLIRNVYGSAGINLLSGENNSSNKNIPHCKKIVMIK